MKIKENYIQLLLAHKESYFEYVLDFIYNNFDKNVRILDVGAGIGSLVSILKKNGYINSYGIELNKEYVQFGRSNKNLHNSLFTQNEFTEPQKSFDLVLSFTVAEHVDDIVEFVNFKLKYIKNNGCFYLFAPDYQNINFYKDIIKTKLRGGAVFLTPFSKGTILRNGYNLMKMYFLIQLKKHRRSPLMIKVNPLPHEVSLGGDADASWCCNYADIQKALFLRQDLKFHKLKVKNALAFKIEHQSNFEQIKKQKSPSVWL